MKKIQFINIILFLISFHDLYAQIDSLWINPRNFYTLEGRQSKYGYKIFFPSKQSDKCKLSLSEVAFWMGDSMYAEVTNYGFEGTRMHTYRFYTDSIVERIVDVYLYDGQFIKNYDETVISHIQVYNDTIEEINNYRNKRVSRSLHFFEDSCGYVTRKTIRKDDFSAEYEDWGNRTWTKDGRYWSSEFSNHKFVHYNLDDHGLVQINVELEFDSLRHYWKILNTSKEMWYLESPDTFFPDRSCEEFARICFTTPLFSKNSNNRQLLILEQLIREDCGLTFAKYYYGKMYKRKMYR